MGVDNPGGHVRREGVDNPRQVGEWYTPGSLERVGVANTGDHKHNINI